MSKEEFARAKSRAKEIGYDIVNTSDVYKVVPDGRTFWETDGIFQSSKKSEIIRFVHGMWAYAMACAELSTKD